VDGAEIINAYEVESQREIGSGGEGGRWDLGESNEGGNGASIWSGASGGSQGRNLQRDLMLVWWNG
jgi:hypothetical protein